MGSKSFSCASTVLFFWGEIFFSKERERERERVVVVVKSPDKRIQGRPSTPGQRRRRRCSRNRRAMYSGTGSGGEAYGSHCGGGVVEVVVVWGEQDNQKNKNRNEDNQKKKPKKGEKSSP